MAITLGTPIRVGGLDNGIVVDQLEIVAISINLMPGHLKDGNGVLSVVLEHPPSGWQTTVKYIDSSVLEFWGAIDQNVLTTLIQAVWDKLQADKRIPNGTVDAQVPASAAAAQALATASAAKASGVSVAAPAQVTGS
jgi:hypothetical protein